MTAVRVTGPRIRVFGLWCFGIRLRYHFGIQRPGWDGGVRVEIDGGGSGRGGALSSGRARTRCVADTRGPGERPDRKSTRLNSSHSSISYAVFCLKKKKKKKKQSRIA